MVLGNQLKQVGEDREISLDAPTVTEKKSFLEDAASTMLLLAIKTLSQRAIVALSNLFTLLTCLSAFFLWYSVLPNPNSYQLVGLGLYAGFILLLHLVKRKT